MKRAAVMLLIGFVVLVAGVEFVARAPATKTMSAEQSYRVQITVTVPEGVTDTVLVTAQVVGLDGLAVGGRCLLEFWIGGETLPGEGVTPAVISATAPTITGSWTPDAGGDYPVIMQEIVAGKHLRVISNLSGNFTLSIEANDVNTDNWYPWVSLGGRAFMGDAFVIST